MPGVKDTVEAILSVVGRCGAICYDTYRKAGIPPVRVVIINSPWRYHIEVMSNPSEIPIATIATLPPIGSTYRRMNIIVFWFRIILLAIGSMINSRC
jgi:hypothetical protein